MTSVDGNGERHSDTEWANSYNGNEQVMDRVVDAAIPAVEGTHMRDAAHRAIAGFSMGGYGAMNLALSNPYRFGVVESWIGFFNGLEGVLHADRPLLRTAPAPLFLLSQSPKSPRRARPTLRPPRPRSKDQCECGV